MSSLRRAQPSYILNVVKKPRKNNSRLIQTVKFDECLKHLFSHNCLTLLDHQLQIKSIKHILTKAI